MAGNHAFSVSENFCYIGGDTPQELFQRLTEFNQFPGMAEQINTFSQVTSGQATTMQQAVANVQAVMPATVIEQQPAQPEQPAQPAAQPQGWGAQAPAQAPQMPQQTFSAPACAHGERNAVKDKNGKWKAWFCSGPRDLPQDQKCSPVWVKQGTPEWDGFPA